MSLQTLFDYLLQHLLTQNGTAIDTAHSNKVPSDASNSLREKIPHVSLSVDNLTVLFSAVRSNEISRTLALSVHKFQGELTLAAHQAHFQITELTISDHAASSQFKCARFSTNFQPTSQLESELFPSTIKSYSAEVQLFQPFLVIYQHDLAWWMEYTRQMQLVDALKKMSNLKNTSSSSEVGRYRFSDDFVRDYSMEGSELEESMTKEAEIEQMESTVFVHLELNKVQCSLHNKSGPGPVVVIGIDLATFSGDHKLRKLEFGVESLWCHRSTTIKQGESLNADFNKHQLGTAIAIGAGLAVFSRNHEKKHLCLQLDDCQLEWEESLIQQISEFIISLRPTKTSEVRKQALSTFDRRDSWSSIDTNSNEPTEFIVQILAKKYVSFTDAKIRSTR